MEPIASHTLDLTDRICFCGSSIGQKTAGARVGRRAGPPPVVWPVPRAAPSPQADYAERSVTRNPSENSSRTSGSDSDVANSFSIRRTR